jgi:hypothetical protein
MNEVADSQIPTQVKRYRPSWIDSLANWIEQLPGQAWSYYLGGGVSLFLLQLMILWLEGALDDGYVPLVQGYLLGAATFFLVLFHYLSRLADSSLAALRPALTVSKDEYEGLHHQLTRLPWGTSILASLIALGFVLLSERILVPFQPEALNPYPTSAGILRVIYLVAWWVFGAFAYHTGHQLRTINRIYSRHTQVDLFHLKPLYAFSNYSALTAMSLAAIPYGWMAINHGDWTAELITLTVMVGITLLAVAAFAWPQFGIHRLAIAEKDRLLDEANKRLKATLEELHTRIDAGALESLHELSSAVSSLKTEVGILEEIPTWPWRPETVRWLASALLLPLGLWLVQLILQRIFGL